MAIKKSVESLKETDLKGKRVDLNIPLDDTFKITDDNWTRAAAVPTIKYLMSYMARVIFFLASHLLCLHGNLSLTMSPSPSQPVAPRCLSSIVVLAALLLLRPCNAAIGIAASYDPPYAPTACFRYDQLQFPPNFLFAAAGEEIWDNGAACGRQYWVRCVSGDRPKICSSTLPVQVKIVDRALTAVSRSSLDRATISLSKTGSRPSQIHPHHPSTSSYNRFEVNKRTIWKGSKAK